MTRFDRLCFTVYLSSLGLWAGVLAMTAAAAAVTFPTVKTLDPVVPSLDPASRPHWMFVAGKVVSGVFLISHGAQAVCAVLALAAAVCLMRSAEHGQRVRRSVTLACTAGAIGVLASYLLALWPRMRENLHAYWDNLSAGQLAAAKTAQQAFDADHPRASLMMQAMLVLVLVALVSGVWKSTAGGRQSK
jgi:hypothetical protein